MTSRIVLLALFAFPGCTAVLDLGALQNGDAGADVGPRDGGPDAPVDVGPIDAPPIPDAPIDAGEVDALVPDDGGADDAGADAGDDTVDLDGTVVGLPAGSTVTLRNGTQTLDVVGPATGFTMTVPRGSTYDIEVDTAPSTLLCVLYRGDGTASADVTNLFLGCSTAVDLDSWIPFDDGDDHAVRGVDWTTSTGTIPFVTDRAGQASSAVGAASSGFQRLMNWAIDGRGTAPAFSAQITLSMWVRIPASVPATPAAADMLIGYQNFTLPASTIELNIGWPGSNPRAYIYLYWDGGFDRAETQSTTVLARDRWHHLTIAIRGPGSTLTDFTRDVYVDGVREGSTGTCCGWGDTRTFYWVFNPSRLERDDLRIYRRTLSDAEIAGIYAAENVP